MMDVAHTLRYLSFVSLSIAVGGACVLQAQLNVALTRSLYISCRASLYSFATGFLILALIKSKTIYKTLTDSQESMRIYNELRWYWAIGGGCAASASITAAVVLLAHMTASAFFVCCILGQIVMSSVVDSRGWFGYSPHPFTPHKFGGAALILAGAVMAQQWDVAMEWTLLLGTSFLAFCVGLGLPIEAGFNKKLSLILRSPSLALCSSFLVATCVLLIVNLLSLFIVPLDYNTSTARWYMWMTGGVNAFNALMSVIVPSHIGVTVYFLCVILGQLATAMFIDVANGMQVSPVKIAGILAALVGIVIIATQKKHESPQEETVDNEDSIRLQDAIRVNKNWALSKTGQQSLDDYSIEKPIEMRQDTRPESYTPQSNSIV